MKSASWEEVLEALPDPAFFEVVRHYLGPVRTPFHKPELSIRMEEFFSRESVLERAMDYIGPEDARMLTLVAFHGRPSETNLRELSRHLGLPAFREKLLNLEERLLIIRTEASGQRSYALTPLGTKALDAGLLGPGTLAGPGEKGKAPESVPWFGDNFLNTALAVLSEGIPLFKKEGGWRKKALEILAERFPSLFRDGRGEDRLLMAGRGLLSAGLIERKGDVMAPIPDAWREMEGRSAENRLALIRARAAAGRGVPAESAVAGIRLITEFLPEGRFYAAEALADLFRLAVGSEASYSPMGARRVIFHLELMGELVSDGKGKFARPGKAELAAGGPKMTMTPVGDITLSPGMPLFCDLALSAEPISSDIVAVFRMDKGRFMAGLDRGIRPERLFGRIESATGRPVPENVLTLAREWQAEYESTALSLAAVFTAEGIARQIIAETGVLEPYCLSSPAEGVWILDPSEENGWREALATIGIERIPPLRTPSGGSLGPERPPIDDVPAALSWNGDFAEPALARHSWEKKEEADIGGILDGLRRRAEAADLSDEDRETFEERLLRRIILVPEQIRAGAWRYEVMSAKGLDYRGKIRLAEAAIAARNDRLEVTHAAGNEVRTDLVIPGRLEKDGDDHVLTGVLLPDETEVRIKMRKIGFLKRVRISLF